MPRGAICLIVLLVAMAVWVAPSRAQAASGKLAVPTLFSSPSLYGVSGLLAQKAAQAAQAQGYIVIGPDAVATAAGRDNMKKAAQCDLKPACLMSYLSGFGADRALVGSIDRDDVHYVVHLVLIDLSKGDLLGSGQRTVLIASRQLESEFDAMLPDVLAGKMQAITQLKVTSNAKHARVTIDDRPMGEVPLTVELSPGKHEIKVEKVNYLPSDRFVDAKIGETTPVEIALTLLPNRYDPDEAMAQPVIEHREGQSDTNDKVLGAPIGSLIALGVGVAAAGVGTYFGVQTRNLQAEAVDTDHDGALNITRVQAMTGQRDALVANIFFIGAGVAAATAVGLFIFDGNNAPPAASTSPSNTSPTPPTPKAGVMLMPGGAVATLGGSF